MDESNNLKGKVFSGLIWSFGERIAAQGVSFVLSIILARLVAPSEYGTISMVLVFINIANVFVSTGLGESLIQKKEANDVDFSSMFYVTLVVSWLIYGVLFLFAPLIGKLYNMPQIVLVLRVLSLMIPLSAVTTIQQAYVSRHMMFKKFFYSTLVGTIISGVIGIFMAYCGVGVWALVAQYLINSILNTVVLFFIVPWRPKLLFSVQSAKELFSFGWKLVMANLINSIYNELRSLIIGAKYTSADLAFYNKGNHFPSLAIVNIDAAIGKVVFPAMVKATDTPGRLKQISRRSMKMSAYLVFPIVAGIGVVAEPLIRLLLTDKWLDSVSYLQWGCLFYACQPVQTTNWQIIKARGRSDLCFKLEVVKKIIGVTMIIFSMNFGVKAIAISSALFGVLSMIINIIPNKKLIDYSMREQINDLWPSIWMTALMVSVIVLLNQLQLEDVIQLALDIIVGVIIYVGLSILTKNGSFTYLLDTLKTLFTKKNFI